MLTGPCLFKVDYQLHGEIFTHPFYVVAETFEQAVIAANNHIEEMHGEAKLSSVTQQDSEVVIA